MLFCEAWKADEQKNGTIPKRLVNFVVHNI